MGTSVWKGHISFGLVAFPVKLHAAARSQAVSFNQLHQCDHSRVKQVLYCQAEDKPVSRSELVKGFEYEKDRYVVVEERELDQMAPRSSRVMEVLEFVPQAEVDPVFLDASYYVVPERAGEKPYTLLYEALRRSGYVSIAQLTMHSREHLVLLRPGRFGLVLHTLFYSDEVRTLDEFRTDTEWVAPQELELAHLLVESLAAGFEPAKYKDRYRENLRALLDAKIRGEELKLGAMEPAPAPVPDILEALKASLERLKKPVVVAQQPPQPTPAPKRTRKALAS
jgi:DNA end-binding protein Ku